MNTAELVRSIELAVWAELGKRPWFGKHVEEEAMELLEKDLKAAITEVVAS